MSPIFYSKSVLYGGEESWKWEKVQQIQKDVHHFVYMHVAKRNTAKTGNINK